MLLGLKRLGLEPRSQAYRRALLALSRAMVEDSAVPNQKFCAQRLQYWLLSRPEKLTRRSVDECTPFWRHAVESSKSDMVAGIARALLAEYEQHGGRAP